MILCLISIPIIAAILWKNDGESWGGWIWGILGFLGFLAIMAMIAG